MEHRRHENQDVDVVLTNYSTDILRLETPLENNRSSGDTGIGREQLQSTHMVHRERIIENRILATKIKIPDLDLTAIYHRLVAEHAAFRLTGRARRIHDHRNIIFAARWYSEVGQELIIGQEIFEDQGPGDHLVETDDALNRVDGRSKLKDIIAVCSFSQFGGKEQGDRPRIADDIFHLRILVSRIDPEPDRTYRNKCEVKLIGVC